MKKIFFSMLVFCILAFTQGCASSKGRMAVYVTGHNRAITENEKRVLESRIVASFVNSGKYEIVERSDAFLAEIQKEQETQRSGSIDDRQISKLGKQFGVQFVFVANVTKPNDSERDISARITNVETARVVNSTTENSKLEDMNQLKEVSNKIVNHMLKNNKGGGNK